MTGAATAATTVPFTVNMSEAVNVTGTPRIAVDVGGVTRYATYASGTGTSALTFNYTMVAGDVDLDGVTLTSPIDLNGGTLKDLNGNDAALTFTLPNTSGVKISYPSLSMDFTADSDGQYTLNGTTYNTLASLLTATGGSFTRASVGTYFDSSGVMQTAASGTPRFDYDPVTHAAKGILIEETRTNYISNSQAGGSVVGSPGTPPTSWAYGDSGFGVTNSVAGKGTINGMPYTDFRFQGNLPASGGWFQLVFGYSPSASATTSTDLVASLYLSLVSGSIPNTTGLIVSEQNGGAYLGNRTLLSIPVSSITSTLTRFSGTAKPAQATTNNVIGSRLIWSSTGSPVAMDFTLRVAAPQLEIGSFATSYIPTTSSSAVARAADSLDIATPTWLNSSLGTFYGEWNIDKYMGPFPRVIVSQQASIKVPIGINSGVTLSFYDGAWRNSSSTINAAGTLNKTAISYSGTTASYTANGNAATSTAYAGTLTATDIYPFYDSGHLSESSTGHFIKLKYYPARIPNTQLQLLTQ